MKTGKFQELQDHLSHEEYQAVHDFVEKVKAGSVDANQWNDISIGKIDRAIVLTEKGQEPQVKEYHRKFADIHITVDGLDKMFIGTEILEVVSPYDDEKDFELVKSPTTTTLVLTPIEFALISPKIIHINSLGKDSRKVVVKVKADA